MKSLIRDTAALQLDGGDVRPPALPLAARGRAGSLFERRAIKMILDDEEDDSDSSDDEDDAHKKDSKPAALPIPSLAALQKTVMLPLGETESVAEGQKIWTGPVLYSAVAFSFGDGSLTAAHIPQNRGTREWYNGIKRFSDQTSTASTGSAIFMFKASHRLADNEEFHITQTGTGVYDIGRVKTVDVLYNANQNPMPCYFLAGKADEAVVEVWKNGGSRPYKRINVDGGKILDLPQPTRLRSGSLR